MHLSTFQYLAYLFCLGCVFCSYSRETSLESIKAEKNHWRKQLVKGERGCYHMQAQHVGQKKKPIRKESFRVFLWGLWGFGFFMDFFFCIV